MAVKTISASEAALRKHVRVLAALAGVFASAAVIIPQWMPRRLDGLASGMDAIAVFLGFSFLTFVVGVATPIYAYARAVKLGIRMPAAAFAPLALLVAAILAIVVIGQIRKRTREVEFRPAPKPPAHTQPVE
jgi:nitrate/nitrite transporter NarK